MTLGTFRKSTTGRRLALAVRLIEQVAILGPYWRSRAIGVAEDLDRADHIVTTLIRSLRRDAQGGPTP